MTTFMAAGISPAFSLLAKDLDVTITAATYLTSSQIAAHGFAPLFWRPIANHYGRRPVWIISTLGSCLFNIGCANSHTYTAQQVCRIFTTLFISSSVGIGPVVVTETFFSKQRASKMVLRFLCLSIIKLIKLVRDSGHWEQLLALLPDHSSWDSWPTELEGGSGFIGSLPL
jgi:MFS family permease